MTVWRVGSATEGWRAQPDGNGVCRIWPNQSREKVTAIMPGAIRLENGEPAAEETVHFPFDDHTIPFTKGLLLSLVPGSKTAGDYLTGSSYDPEHPGWPVVRFGPPGAPDHREVICPTVIRVGDEYRMWYICRGESDPTQDGAPYGGRPMDARRRMAYAVSGDGIR